MQLKELKLLNDDDKKENAMEKGNRHSSLSSAKPLCKFSIYVTQLDSSEFSPDFTVKKGRPDLREEISMLSIFGNEAVVFACGPECLVNDCADLTREFNVSFRHETFLL